MDKVAFAFFLLFIIGYLIGSIPFGLILGKIFGIKDIRKVGSGNIGATNALRTGNIFYAALTLFFDVSKGAVPFYLLNTANTENGIIGGMVYIATWGIAVGTVFGHCFPIWLKFRGGKGVATTFGVLFAATPWTGFVAAVTWGIVAGFSRYSSLSALCAVAIAPVVTLIYYGVIPAVITVLITALVIWRHKDNIKRLMAGTEPKIGAAKKGQDESSSTQS
ncbi:MAG: glycerol-3-phosphate 1-O-acyltransferase PlsY [Pseudomonadota bacterium]